MQKKKMPDFSEFYEVCVFAQMKFRDNTEVHVFRRIIRGRIERFSVHSSMVLLVKVLLILKALYKILDTSFMKISSEIYERHLKVVESKVFSIRYAYFQFSFIVNYHKSNH